MSRPTDASALPYRSALVLAPALMGLAFAIDRSPQADSSEELLTLVHAHPDSWLVAGSLFLVAGLAWLVAGVGILRWFGDRSRLLGLGGLAMAAGGISLSLLDAAGIYLPGLAGSGATVEQQVSVVEHVESSAPLLVIEIVHVAGWGLGLLLVAIGLLRATSLPRWIPALLVISLAGMVAFAQGPALVAAAAVQVLGFLGLALHLTGETDRVSVPEQRVSAPQPS